MESNGVGTTADGIDGLSVGFGDIFHDDIVTYQPSVSLFLVATDIRELGGHNAIPRDVFKVFGAVVWSYRKSFIRFPNQFLVVVGTLEVFLYLRFPLLGADRWKFPEEFLLFFHIIMIVCYLRLKRYFQFAKISVFFKGQEGKCKNPPR